MHRVIVALTLSSLFCGGCAEESGTRPALTDRRFVWTTESRPYKVVALGGSNVPAIGDQARTVQAIYFEADDQNDVASALDEVYSELKADIEAAQPDAKYRRINVSFYDMEGDMEHDPGAWLCTLTIAPQEGEAFPPDAAELAQWRWRDPTARPTQQQRQIDWDYVQALELADRSVESSVNSQLQGLDASERRAIYERTYAEESAAARDQLATENDMTLDELQSVLDRVLAWKYAGETVENVAVDESPPESGNVEGLADDDSSSSQTDAPESPD